MQTFARRVIIAVPALLLLSLVVFLLLEMTPGDVTQAVLEDTASDAAAAQLRGELNLDRSVWWRYLDYLGGVFRGDLGVSARTGLAVTDEIALRLPYTLVLTVSAVVIGVTVGVLTGTLAALKRNTVWDAAVTGMISIGMAVPTFWVALMLVGFFSLRLGWMPVFGADSPKHLILPAVSAALPLIPGVARLTRASLLEVLGQDYVLVARAKGLQKPLVLWRHVGPVAAIPVVTYVGMQTVHLIGSVVVIETIFNWPGLGGLAIRAALDRDPMLLQGTTLVIAALTFVVLLATDLIVLSLDPRISRAAVG